MYRRKQSLSSDQGPAGSGQTASLGVPSRGRVGSPVLGPSTISGPNSRASSSSQVPASPQNYTFPVAKVLFYLSSGDLGLIPSVVGCPPVNGASCRSVGEVSSGKSLGLVRPFIPRWPGGAAGEACLLGSDSCSLPKASRPQRGGKCLLEKHKGHKCLGLHSMEQRTWLPVTGPENKACPSTRLIKLPTWSLRPAPGRQIIFSHGALGKGQGGIDS